MRAQGRGVIINCASASGLRNANLGLSLYSASKAAVVSLTKSAALEYGPAIRINAVSPGRIETPMMLGSKIADMSVVAQGLPLKRLGTARGGRQRRGLAGLRCGELRHRPHPAGRRRLRRDLKAVIPEFRTAQYPGTQVDGTSSWPLGPGSPRSRASAGMTGIRQP